MIAVPLLAAVAGCSSAIWRGCHSCHDRSPRGRARLATRVVFAIAHAGVSGCASRRFWLLRGEGATRLRVGPAIVSVGPNYVSKAPVRGRSRWGSCVTEPQRVPCRRRRLLGNGARFGPLVAPFVVSGLATVSTRGALPSVPNGRLSITNGYVCDDFETAGPCTPRAYGSSMTTRGRVRRSRWRRRGRSLAAWARGGRRAGWGRQPETGFGGIQLYMQRASRPTKTREVYDRMYLRMQPGWEGNRPSCRAPTILLPSQDWRQPSIAHLWSTSPRTCWSIRRAVSMHRAGESTTSRLRQPRLAGLPAWGYPAVRCRHADTWLCVEAHVRLNDPGAANGVQEFWVDGGLEAPARRT